MSNDRPIIIATRGSALALAQSRLIQARCQAAFPGRTFELNILKTTGDKLQTVSLLQPSQESTKGLFTKELEIALLDGAADFAVHSLKDLPTELPEGLALAAVSEREDPRDILIYRDPASAKPGARAFPPGLQLEQLPPAATIATGSTRRQAQVLALRPDLKTVPIRGNVGTRLQKLLDQPELDAIILALAGLNRLGVTRDAEGRLSGGGIPSGCIATPLPIEQMIPCVGQAALGIETRAHDPAIADICHALNHPGTFSCVAAERAFLAQMGGGCLSPVAAYAQLSGDSLHLRAISFRDGPLRRAAQTAPAAEAIALGQSVARAISA